MTLTPASLAALTCGSMVPGSMPEIRSTMSNLSRIAYSMPWTHWLGWPWFSHSFTSRPTSLAGRFFAIDDAFQERVAAVVGDRKHLLSGRAFLGVECRPRSCEHRLRGISDEIGLCLGETIRSRVGARGQTSCRRRRACYDRGQQNCHSHETLPLLDPKRGKAGVGNRNQQCIRMQ